MTSKFERLCKDIGACRICADRFAETATAHVPRPVVWLSEGARILVAGQAPGMRVHISGRPFTDPSGDRLRDWMGLSEQEFYDQRQLSIMPMAFCFPGYNAAGSDLPPPAICSRTWHSKVLQARAPHDLVVLVGGYAHQWHLGKVGTVTQTVARWRDFGPNVMPLPHPSWRNSGWLHKNPWFEQEVLPALKSRVQEVLHG